MSASDHTPNRSAGPPDWDAIARHLAGEGSAAESADVAAWLAAHPEDARALSLLGAAGDRTREAPAVDVEAALARVHERMRVLETPSSPSRHNTPVIPLRAPAPAWRRRQGWWAAAAVVVLAVGVARARRETPLAEPRVYATAVGTRTTLKLPDGTGVVLGPASELKTVEGYGDGRREVELRGTAFFEVVHDAERPFAVRTAGAVITDIGTAFNVRGDGDEGVEVSVREGSVRVQADRGADVVLAAGDLATLQAGGRLVVQRAGASDDDQAWTNGRLVFREAPLARVRTDLRRWFGVELVVADSVLASRHLTASFMNESRTQVFEVIALALGATFETHGDTVTLRPASLTVRPRK
ncbi:MAG: FecR domain-containing protein [Gemmatimonadota bacterium]|nr:FecR domain-containing protein [Gemmatimonadota bacterium]